MLVQRPVKSSTRSLSLICRSRVWSVIYIALFRLIPELAAAVSVKVVKSESRFKLSVALHLIAYDPTRLALSRTNEGFSVILMSPLS